MTVGRRQRFEDQDGSRRVQGCVHSSAHLRIRAGRLSLPAAGSRPLGGRMYDLLWHVRDEQGLPVQAVGWIPFRQRSNSPRLQTLNALPRKAPACPPSVLRRRLAGHRREWRWTADHVFAAASSAATLSCSRMERGSKPITRLRSACGPQTPFDAQPRRKPIGLAAIQRTTRSLPDRLSCRCMIRLTQAG